MHEYAVLIIVAHGLIYWCSGLVLLFECVQGSWSLWLEKQIQIDTKKQDIESELVLESDEQAVAVRFAAYIMVYLGGLRISVAFSDSCSIVVIVAHTLVLENIMLCNELFERRFKGLGWIGCVFTTNAALLGLVAFSISGCVN